MSSLVYLLRDPSRTLSQALYSSGDRGASVCVLNTSLDPSSPTHGATMVQAGETSLFHAGETVTYKQLLHVVIEAGKVITL